MNYGPRLGRPKAALRVRVCQQDLHLVVAWPDWSGSTGPGARVNVPLIGRRRGAEPDRCRRVCAGLKQWLGVAPVSSGRPKRPRLAGAQFGRTAFLCVQAAVSHGLSGKPPTGRFAAAQGEQTDQPAAIIQSKISLSQDFFRRWCP